jgi:DNA invertase Pin-like site-specific DNA recombinase
VIAAWCDARDWRLERIIHDSPHHGRHPGERPGLAYVLDRLATGTAAGVVVRHFSDLADTAADLAPMLERVNDATAFVMAVDEWLDPDVPPGRLTTGALVDLDEHRQRRTFAAGSGVTLREVPELRARVLAMRQSGMSLQTIADALNASGIPTLRGTNQWRPSAVQVLAGYKPPPTQETLRRNG